MVWKGETEAEMRLAKKHIPAQGGRFEARVSEERKTLWKRAATIRGNTLTEFVLNTMDAAAERTIKEAEFMDLTERDRLAFVKGLLNAPTPPNANLRDAAKRYSKIFPEN